MHQRTLAEIAAEFSGITQEQDELMRRREKVARDLEQIDERLAVLKDAGAESHAALMGVMGNAPDSRTAGATADTHAKGAPQA